MECHTCLIFIYIICGGFFIICGGYNIIHCDLLIIFASWSVICGACCIINGVFFFIYGVYCILHSDTSIIWGALFIMHSNWCEVTRLRSRLISVEYVTSLGFLRQYQLYFRDSDVCKFVCMYVCISLLLPRFQVIKIEAISCFVQKATVSRAKGREKGSFRSDQHLLCQRANSHAVWSTLIGCIL